MRRARAPLLVALALLTAGCLAQEPRPAPEFSVMDFDGNLHNLTTMQGKVVIVDLMATWCLPCVAQMKHLNTVRDAYREEDVMILSIDTDRSEGMDRLQAWMAQNNARWPYGFDSDRIAQKLEMRILPKIVIISPDSQIVFEAQGEAYPASMARVINRYAEPI